MYMCIYMYIYKALEMHVPASLLVYEALSS
jgi:hypothetical protein